MEVEDQAVLAQRVDYWAAQWKRRQLERQAEGEAEAMRLLEKARADVQGEMIEAIADALDQLADIDTTVSSQVVALRLIDILEELTASPDTQDRLPRPVRYIPSRLRAVIRQGAGDEAY
jgi:hypothetical protein